VPASITVPENEICCANDTDVIKKSARNDMLRLRVFKK
jgi:hypothetical protein